MTYSIFRDIPNFIKFLFIGGFNTAVCMLLFWLLNRTGLNYLLSSGLMNVFGVIEGYILNAILLYKSKIRFKDLLKYGNVYLFAFIANLLLMYGFVTGLNLPKLFSQILTTGLLTIINYQIIKLFVFKVKN